MGNHYCGQFIFRTNSGRIIKLAIKDTTSKIHQDMLNLNSPKITLE